MVQDVQVVPLLQAHKFPRRAVISTREENGGVDSRIFLSWAWKFLEYVQYLVTKDSKVPHLSIPVLQLFDRQNIIVYALPAHKSGKTQPLDVVVFSAFKEALRPVVAD